MLPHAAPYCPILPHIPGVQRNPTTGKWIRVNVTDAKYKAMLPPRAGAPIQRFPVDDNKVRWQAWYPPNKQGEQESFTCTATAEEGLAVVLAQVWARHEEWVAANSSIDS